MLNRKGLVGIAAALLTVGSTVWAADQSSCPACDSASSLTPNVVPGGNAVANPLYADDSTASTTPLMMGLDKAGVGKYLENWGISITGYVEGGYMYDLTKPRDTSPGKSAPADGIGFYGTYKNAPMLNQADLQIARTADPTKGKFDVGFMVEGMYGRDAAYIHSNGIYDNTVKDGTGGFDQPDLEQAYVTVAIPVGSGLLLKGGKFATLLGDEVIDATGNLFFSHSYSFTYGIPLTQTGLLASYTFNSEWAATAGFTRGWNESTSDNNGAIDFLGEVVYTGTKLTLTGNFSFGPEGVVGTLPYGPKDNSDYWAVPEIIAAYKVSDELTATADVVYGFANNMSQWYGIAAYASYVYSPMFTFNARAEWYHDGKGATTGAGGLTNGSDVEFYEATVGTQITPMPNDAIFKNLSVRPELRLDYAEHGVLDGSKFSEVTAAIDAIMKF